MSEQPKAAQSVELSAHEIGTVIRAMNLSVDLIPPALHKSYTDAMLKLVEARLRCMPELERKLISTVHRANGGGR